MKIMIGTPINSSTAYIFEKFVKNQKAIHKTVKAEILTVLATEDKKFNPRLPKNFKLLRFKPVIKGRNRIWKIVGARNKLRKFFLSHDFDYLIFMDSDMVFEKNIMNRLIRKAEEGYDVVYNVYKLKNGKIAYSGFGGCLIKRDVMKKIKFRCSENTQVIDEITYFKLDLIKKDFKFYRGFFGKSIHYDKNKKWVMKRRLRFKERIFIFISDLLIKILREKGLIYFPKIIEIGRKVL